MAVVWTIGSFDLKSHPTWGPEEGQWGCFCRGRALGPVLGAHSYFPQSQIVGMLSQEWGDQCGDAERPPHSGSPHHPSPPHPLQVLPP